jgi:cell wall-associated NlpC family hydrolase
MAAIERPRGQRMELQRLSAAVALIAALFANANAFAATFSPDESLACGEAAMQALFGPTDNGVGIVAPAVTVAPAPSAEAAPAALGMPTIRSPRQLLADFALKLRDIRYRRGGRVPSTGFDCSGFVHYVFAHALGIDLPEDSRSQFESGIKVARDQMRTGDLVFFHIRGKRISHVGIYLGDGQFIHSPATGERVRVNRLDEQYWAHRFAGAKRPENLSS